MAMIISRMTSRKTTQDLLSHQMVKLKIGVVRISWDSNNDKYATGGISITSALSELGISNALGVVFVGENSTSAGWVAIYNFESKKLMIYGQEPTNTNTGVLKLSEMANNTVLNGLAFDLFVIGY